MLSNKTFLENRLIRNPTVIFKILSSYYSILKDMLQKVFFIGYCQKYPVLVYNLLKDVNKINKTLEYFFSGE